MPYKPNKANVELEFLILHNGWELDNLGWITPDGEVWNTSHNRPKRMALEEVEDKIAEAERSLEGLRKARQALLKSM